MAAALLLVSALGVLGNDGNPLFMGTCTGSRYQQWDRNPDATKLVKLRATGECIDIDNYGTQDGAKIQLWGCHTDDKDPKHQNQQFTFQADGTITSDLSGKCLGRGSDQAIVGSRIQLATCTGKPNQKWNLNGDGSIVGIDVKLCLDGGAAPPAPRICDLLPGKNQPWCDTKLTIPARVTNLVQNLTVDEKIGLFSTTQARAVTRLNIPAYEWWSEALHGVGGSPGVHFQDPTPCATSFPQVIGTGASFNRSLWNAIGSTISTEARAFNNEGHAGLTYWAPNVNIFRDPRWGRGQETPGEDPYHTSEYAAQFVSGMQGNDPKYLKVSSCCKHYTAYDLEDWGGVDRHHFNAIVSDQDMADTYMPPFQSCVQRGRASSLMCSYNRVNGVPSCANSDIMTKLARQTWGFEGYITSDCGAVDDVYETHKFAPTKEDTCKVTLEAGMDIDCTGGFITGNLKSALDKGVVKMETVDQRIGNLFAVQFRLGMFDPASAQPYLKINYTTAVNTAEARQLALDAARQSIVLLKNNKNVLPLKRLDNIAMIGPHADATHAMQGNYEGNACSLLSPFSVVKSRAKESTYVQGCDVTGTSTAGFGAAKQAAANADATVIVVGINQDVESEGKDRTSIDLPGVQNQLITQVAAAAKTTGKPVVVVYMIGGPVDMSVAKNSPDVDAILWVGYPGQAGGDAIADVLFGVFNPSARLPYTAYSADYVSKLSLFDMSMRPNATSNNPGRSYRFYPGPSVYEYATGLSYSNFTLEIVAAPRTLSLRDVKRVISTQQHVFAIPEEEKPLAAYSVRVNNTGPVAGGFVVMGFVVPLNPGKDDPLRYLHNFEKVFLQSGQSIVIQLQLYARDFTLVDSRGVRQTRAGEWNIILDVPTQVTLPISLL